MKSAHGRKIVGGMGSEISRRTLLASGLAFLSTPVLADQAFAMPMAPLRVGVLSTLPERTLQGVRHRADALNSHHAGLVELIAAAEPTILLDQGVHAMIGAGEALSKMAEASCTPAILTTPGTPSTYVFQAGPTASHTNGALLNAVSQKRVGQLATTPIPSEDFAARGLTPAGSEQVPSEATDLTRIAQQIVAAEPEAVIVNTLPLQDGIAVRDLRASGWTGPILCGPSAVHPSFHAIAGEAAEGVQAIGPWLAAPEQAPPDLPHLESMRRFAQSFTAAHGAPGSHAGFGADALSLLHLAFLGHRDRKQAQAQLAHMCCIGVTGVYNLDRGGLSKDALTTFVSRAGAWTTEQPEPSPPQPPPAAHPQ